jgi:RNA recognition motif-containing protein
MTNPLTEGFDTTKAIFVTNIDLEVQEAHLKQLFGFCGELSKLKFLSHTLASPFKACLLEFKDSSAVETALMLSNTPLLGRVIGVLPADAATPVPASNDATSMAAHAAAAHAAAPPLIDPMLGGGMLVPPPLLMMPSLLLPSTQPSLTSAHGLLPLPVPLSATAATAAAAAAVAVAATSTGTVPLPETSAAHAAPNQQTPEELARTVYVGNVSSSATNADLLRHFGCCGPVTLIRISGSQGQTDATRYAFVEFTTIDAARLAVERMANSIMSGLMLRVSTAKNAIVKPSLSVDLLPPPDAKRKLKERLRRLNDKLTGADKLNGADARSRSRSRSPRRRSRSRSPRR